MKEIKRIHSQKKTHYSLPLSCMVELLNSIIKYISLFFFFLNQIPTTSVVYGYNSNITYTKASVFYDSPYMKIILHNIIVVNYILLVKKTPFK